MNWCWLRNRRHKRTTNKNTHQTKKNCIRCDEHRRKSDRKTKRFSLNTETPKIYRNKSSNNGKAGPTLWSDSIRLYASLLRFQCTCVWAQANLMCGCFFSRCSLVAAQNLVEFAFALNATYTQTNKQTKITISI